MTAVARAVAWAAAVLAATLLREAAHGLTVAADTLDAAAGVETADRCPDTVPDYLLVTS